MILCTGATWPRDLEIPGRSLDGIHFAVSFLEHWQKKQMGNDAPLDMRLMAEGKNVIIIGGGDTGCDCIATSLRQVGSNKSILLNRKINNEKMLYKKFCSLRAQRLLPHSRSFLSHLSKEARTTHGHNSQEFSKWIMATKKSHSSLVVILDNSAPSARYV